jgi:hypothetical protein
MFPLFCYFLPLVYFLSVSIFFLMGYNSLSDGCFICVVGIWRQIIDIYMHISQVTAVVQPWVQRITDIQLNQLQNRYEDSTLRTFNRNSSNKVMSTAHYRIQQECKVWVQHITDIQQERLLYRYEYNSSEILNRNSCSTGMRTVHNIYSTGTAVVQECKQYITVIRQLQL